MAFEYVGSTTLHCPHCKRIARNDVHAEQWQRQSDGDTYFHKCSGCKQKFGYERVKVITYTIHKL